MPFLWIFPALSILLKMDYYGIRNILPWIRNFLISRKQCVVIDEVKSRFVTVASGLPQGTVLAALLFLIFINDLPESVTSSFTGVFCDDTLIAKEICDTSDIEHLQADLNSVLKWTKLWGMKFNTLKCVTMTVTNKRNPITSTYFLGNEALSKKDQIKYLGVIVDKKLTFKDHINEKCKNATTILNMLRRNLYFAPSSVKRKAYLSCVLPILEYGSISWAPTSEKLNKSIEMVQHRAAKFIANTHSKKSDYKNFSISKLLKQLNLETLEERRTKARLTMVYKILNGHVILEPEMLPKVLHKRSRKCNSETVGYEKELIEPQPR